MYLLSFDVDELFLLHECVRQTREAPVYGTEHDLEFVQRVWDGVLALQGTERGTAYSLSLTRGECLQVTRQVSAREMQVARPIGREILTKVFAALREPEEADDVCTVPEAFLRGDFRTDPDADNCALADPGTGAAVES